VVVVLVDVTELDVVVDVVVRLVETVVVTVGENVVDVDRGGVVTWATPRKALAGEARPETKPASGNTSNNTIVT